MQSRTFSLKTWENCTNALKKNKKKTDKRTGISRSVVAHVETAIKGGRLTSLLSRSYLNLSPERSGSKPPAVYRHRKQVLIQFMRPYPLLAASLAAEAAGRHEEGEWGWTYLFTSKPVYLSCSLPTPYIPLIHCILYDALLCP